MESQRLHSISVNSSVKSSYLWRLVAEKLLVGCHQGKRTIQISPSGIIIQDLKLRSLKIAIPQWCLSILFFKKQLNLPIFKIKITFSKILIRFNSIKFLKIQDYFNHGFGHVTVNSDSLKEAVALIVSYSFFLGIQSRVDCFPGDSVPSGCFFVAFFLGIQSRVDCFPRRLSP
jgi:hypothetical protein